MSQCMCETFIAFFPLEIQQSISMKWKINDIRISSCCDLNYSRMVCKKICTIPILYLYSNNLVFDVGVQLQDICFPRP